MSKKAELSPDARALWFALKLHATQPTAVESQIISYLMSLPSKAVILERQYIARTIGLTEKAVSEALLTLEEKGAIRVRKNHADVEIDFDFASPLFGGVS